MNRREFLPLIAAAPVALVSGMHQPIETPLRAYSAADILQNIVNHPFEDIFAVSIDICSHGVEIASHEFVKRKMRPPTLLFVSPADYFPAREIIIKSTHPYVSNLRIMKLHIYDNDSWSVGDERSGGFGSEGA